MAQMIYPGTAGPEDVRVGKTFSAGPYYNAEGALDPSSVGVSEIYKLTDVTGPTTATASQLQYVISFTLTKDIKNITSVTLSTQSSVGYITSSVTGSNIKIYPQGSYIYMFPGYTTADLKLTLVGGGSVTTGLSKLTYDPATRTGQVTLTVNGASVQQTGGNLLIELKVCGFS